MAADATENFQQERQWAEGLDDEDLDALRQAHHDDTKIVLESPVRLGYYSLLCLMMNRMIGTGIFNSASVVFSNTQSIGGSLMLWFYGAVLALCGIFVYIELGLTIPRYMVRGRMISTPRSGGELNYLNYYLKNPMFFATCTYGISFIILGNSAANCVAFGQSVLEAANVTLNPERVCSIAIAVNTFCCLLHSISRRWGILLNNFLGTIKLLMLLFFIIIGFKWLKPDVASANLSIHTSFSREHTPRMPYRYAEALLFVMFPYSGFHQVNYVLAEIDQPQKKFKRAAGLGVFFISTLFVVVNIAYAAVVPKAELFEGIDVGARFFQLTIGNAISNSSHTGRLYSGLRAVSAIGNIIVVTFTAARVKQEIAKEGILPYSLLFAESYDLSLRRLLGLPRPKESLGIHFHTEKTPAATMALHWLVTNMIIIPALFTMKPKPYSPNPAYTFLVTFYAYVLDVFWFGCVGFGLLYLRLWPGTGWREVSSFNPWLSTIAALVFFLMNLFPIIGVWIPDSAVKYLARTSDLVRWYGGPTVGVVVLALSVIYWLIFAGMNHQREIREGKELAVERKPIILEDEGSFIQLYEIVGLRWRVSGGDVNLRSL